MNYTMNLQRLITEYKQLRTLQGLTPQERGQRFNQFIADLLRCWGIDAKANIGTGYGEIDVAFKLEETQFIGEVKWEKGRINSDPITKLKTRLDQRLKDNTGILLSMTGFTPAAVKQLNVGSQLSLLLLDDKHVEAMLSGFISPQEMFSRLKEKAQIYGEGYVPLKNLLSSYELAKLDLDIDFSKWDTPLNVKSEPGFEAEVVAANLPTSQTKIAEYKKDQILFTRPEGIYLLDIAGKKVEPFLAVPDCKHIVVTHDQWVYIARSIGVARYKPEEGIQIVGGGFSNGSITNKVLLLGNGSDVWVVTDEYAPAILREDHLSLSPPDPPAPTITKLGEKLGDEQRYSTKLFGGSVNNVALVGDNQFLALSEAWGEQFLLPPLEGPAQSMWYGLWTKYPQFKAALCLPDGQVLAALAGVQELRHLAPKGTSLKSRNSYGINLCVGHIAADTPTSIAQLNVFGEPIALAHSVNGGGYLLTDCVKDNGDTTAVLIHWKWKQPSQTP